MTRVEKYRKYRQEIENMKSEDFSSKKEAGDKIGDGGSRKIGYDKVINIHEMYEPNDKKHKTKHRIQITKAKVTYWSIALLVIAILVVAIIIVAINL